MITRASEHGSGDGSGARAFAFGLIASLIAAARAIDQVERRSNRIYGVERDRPSVRKYLVATAPA